MSRQQHIEKILAESDLFTNISKEAALEIANVAEEILLPANTIIFNQGEPGRYCYIVVSGRVKGFRANREGDAVDFMALGPGESFGELALLTDEPRPISAQTIDETHLIALPKDKCAPILARHGDVTAAIGKRVAHWLHIASAALENEASRQYEAPKSTWRDFVLIVGLGIVCAVIFNGSNPKAIPFLPKATLDASVLFLKPSEALDKRNNEGAMIIDAMPSGFYEREHIEGAVSLPLAIFDFMYDMSLSHVDKNTGIIIYGRTISKRYDEEVANKLVIRGHNHVYILKGGIRAWKKTGYPVEP